MDPTTLRMFSGAAAAAAPLVVITYFMADTYYPVGNATSTLSWNVANATSVSISNIGTVAASGSYGVTANGTAITYTLTAINLDGISATSSITITWSTYCWWAQHGRPEWC
jgi:hypothetical protein